MPMLVLQLSNKYCIDGVWYVFVGELVILFDCVHLWVVPGCQKNDKGIVISSLSGLHVNIDVDE